MLNKTTIAIAAETVVNEVKIAEHSAVIKDDLNVTFNCRHIEKELCMYHRDVVRADRAEFEDLAYRIRNGLLHTEE